MNIGMSELLRLAILGNSGSGKSTLARWVADQRGAALLDLDTVAWEPDQIAVPRDAGAAQADVLVFCQSNAQWVIEGCYASLVATVLPLGPRLLLLNPGEEQCLQNCRSRPWEPHKYASREEQDQRLAGLLAWVSDYYRRDGEMSLAGHLALYAAYSGTKRELTAQPSLESPPDELLAWLG